MVTHARGRMKLRKGRGIWTHDNFNRVIENPLVDIQVKPEGREGASHVAVW